MKLHAPHTCSPQRDSRRPYTLDLRQVLWAALLIVLLLLLAGCRAHRPMLTAERSDSTHIELRTTLSYRTDTVRLTLAAQSAERLTTADTSHLETDYAESDVYLQPDGTLRHTLRQREQTVEAPVQTPIVTRDSIVYRDRVRTETVTVRLRRPWWQVALWALAAAGVGAGVALYLRHKLRQKVSI